MTTQDCAEAPKTPDLCPACGRAMVEFNPDEWACVHSDCGGAAEIVDQMSTDDIEGILRAGKIDGQGTIKRNWDV